MKPPEEMEKAVQKSPLQKTARAPQPAVGRRCDNRNGEAADSRGSGRNMSPLRASMMRLPAPEVWTHRRTSALSDTARLAKNCAATVTLKNP